MRSDAWHAYCEILRKNGDIRTDDEIFEESKESLTYTDEEADELVQKLEDKCDVDYILDENGRWVTVTKEELIKNVRRQTKIRRI